MKNFIISILFIVFSSAFNGCSTNTVTEPVVAVYSLSIPHSNSFYSIEENEDTEKKNRNSFWKLFALAITVLLVVLFL